MIRWMRMLFHRPTAEGGAEAKKATQEGLQDVHDKWPEVHHVSGRLRELRERNEFAEQIMLTMRLRQR